MFEVQITTDTAAFKALDPIAWDCHNRARRRECARILRVIAEKLDDGYESSFMTDRNGVGVGLYRNVVGDPTR